MECNWNLCNLKFDSAKELHTHVHQNHMKEPRCQWGPCKYEFHKRSQLISHVIVHIPYFPHHCKRCDKKFKRKYDLTKHMFSVHDEDNSSQNRNQIYESALKKMMASKVSLAFILN